MKRGSASVVKKYLDRLTSDIQTRQSDQVVHERNIAFQLVNYSNHTAPFNNNQGVFKRNSQGHIQV